MPSRWKSSITKFLLFLSWAYFGLLFGWGIANRLWGDGFWWLFLLNVFAIYLFAPSPLLILGGFYTRRKSVWIPALLACGWAIFLYGSLFLPPSGPVPEGQSLTVMTYNVLGYNQRIEPVIESFRDSDADVIAIYELNLPLAAALRESLSDVYPHQILDPQQGVKGAGVISRFRLEPTGEKLPGKWMGEPQILKLDLNGTQITILHAHPFASKLSSPARMQQIIQARGQQAKTIQEYAQSHPGPLIVPMDLNATPQNSPYKIITRVLEDSWLEAGWGLGHTFPGADSPGSSRPHLAGIAVPMWLIRIDYIFHSRHFVATDARYGPWDGNSDHAPVMATLILKAEGIEEKAE